MKLTGFLKDKVDAVETKEEKRSIIAEAGMELTDEELDSVSGGRAKPAASKYCSTCGAWTTPKNGKCPNCGNSY